MSLALVQALARSETPAEFASAHLLSWVREDALPEATTLDADAQARLHAGADGDVEGPFAQLVLSGRMGRGTALMGLCVERTDVGAEKAQSRKRRAVFNVHSWIRLPVNHDDWDAAAERLGVSRHPHPHGSVTWKLRIPVAAVSHWRARRQETRSRFLQQAGISEKLTVELPTRAVEELCRYRDLGRFVTRYCESLRLLAARRGKEGEERRQLLRFAKATDLPKSSAERIHNVWQALGEIARLERRRQRLMIALSHRETLEDFAPMLQKTFGVSTSAARRHASVMASVSQLPAHQPAREAFRRFLQTGRPGRGNARRADERRGHDRLAVDMPVIVRADGLDLPAQMQDISVSGARLSVGLDIARGTPIRLRLPDGSTFDAAVRGNQDGRLGIRFNRLLDLSTLEWLTGG